MYSPVVSVNNRNLFEFHERVESCLYFFLFLILFFFPFFLSRRLRLPATSSARHRFAITTINHGRASAGRNVFTNRDEITKFKYV